MVNAKRERYISASLFSEEFRSVAPLFITWEPLKVLSSISSVYTALNALQIILFQ